MNANVNGLIHPYLFFEGRCEEAIEFYKKALGAEVQMMMRYKESPEPPPPGSMPAGYENKILHGQIRIGQAVVMMSDGHCSGKTTFGGFSLSLSYSTEADVDRYFNALAEGGTIIMPLAKTFFSPRFGMVSDHFGVGWMLIRPADMPPK
jgi:PhnB protein